MICDKNKCTGCFACYNICSKNAIKMIEDDNGFIYPQIDKEKCVDCGLCKKICPSINNVEFYKNQECYATYSKNEDIRQKSTSGGIATTLSKEIINEGGVVYGASYGKECAVNHIRVTNLKDLEKLQGSKYVHSYINDTYKMVKDDLKENMKVLFIGTPCQVSGLKKFLKKDYQNLILIDIICHGVPSQKYLKDEVNRINGNVDVSRVDFRNGNKYGFFIIKDNDIIFQTDRENSPYCDAFMKTLSLRENCYKCIYAGADRVSDITIGDFWGLSKKSKFYDDKEKGVSTFIISTQKGKEVFTRYLDNFYIEKREYSESVNGNTQLRIPAPKNKNADKFKSDFIKYGFKKAYNRSTRMSRLKRSVKKLLRK